MRNRKLLITTIKHESDKLIDEQTLSWHKRAVYCITKINDITIASESVDNTIVTYKFIFFAQ